MSKDTFAFVVALEVVAIVLEASVEPGPTEGEKTALGARWGVRRSVRGWLADKLTLGAVGRLEGGVFDVHELRVYQITCTKMSSMSVYARVHANSSKAHSTQRYARESITSAQNVERRA